MQSYDSPQSLPLLAPRPFLIANGELDPRCPLGGLEEPVQEAKAAYAAAGFPDNFRVYIEKGLAHAASHGLDREVNAWLDQHLLQN